MKRLNTAPRQAWGGLQRVTKGNSYKRDAGSSAELQL
jgi:hypothetical protein